MTVVSPCTGICKLDEATGWCLGCARTGDEIAEWRGHGHEWRAEVWEALPARFEALGVGCRRLPWETRDIQDFVVRSLRRASGTWIIGVVGAVAEFAAKPGASVIVETDGSIITAVTAGGRLRFLIDDRVRALTFDPHETPAQRQRVVLAVTRERGRLPVSAGLADLGPDINAVSPLDRDLRLYDLGLGRKEARFCVRCASDAAEKALAAASGTALAEALPRIAPVLLQDSPQCVVESALGRIEVLTAIPQPGEISPKGAHTPLLPEHLTTRRALPAGMDLPRAYLPGAIFYPAG